MSDAVEAVRILVIDDEPDMRAVLRNAFEDAGYSVVEVADKAAVFSALEAQRFALVTLDLGLGHVDGLELAREIRAVQNVPIVMITGRASPIDRVVGLEHGADDYIVKPFLTREAVLRVQRVLARYASPTVDPLGESQGGRRIAFDHCVLDLQKREVIQNGGEIVDLTEIEFRLLALLVENPARVLSRDEIAHTLLGHAWSPLDRTIDGHIARLRRKIEPLSDEPKMIKSVRGVGYVFTSDVSAS